MPEYRIRETGKLTFDLSSQFPNCSIPRICTPEDFDALGVDPVFEGPLPPTTQFQTAYRDGVEHIGGKWFTKYSISNWSEDAISAATEQKWESVRSIRNERLAACDWTQLPDAPVDAAVWAVYRQALRDITEQVDPFNITWPKEPK